jgi:hypothetical protein
MRTGDPAYLPDNEGISILTTSFTAISHPYWLDPTVWFTEAR